MLCLQYHIIYRNISYRCSGIVTCIDQPDSCLYTPLMIMEFVSEFILLFIFLSEPPSDPVPERVAGEAESVPEDAGGPLSQTGQGQFKDGGQFSSPLTQRNRFILSSNSSSRLFPWYKSSFPTLWVVPLSKLHPSTWGRPSLTATALPPSSSSSPQAPTPWLTC